MSHLHGIREKRRKGRCWVERFPRASPIVTHGCVIFLSEGVRCDSRIAVLRSSSILPLVLQDRHAGYSSLELTFGCAGGY